VVIHLFSYLLYIKIPVFIFCIFRILFFLVKLVHFIVLADYFQVLVLLLNDLWSYYWSLFTHLIYLYYFIFWMKNLHSIENRITNLRIQCFELFTQESWLGMHLAWNLTQLGCYFFWEPSLLTQLFDFLKPVLAKRIWFQNFNKGVLNESIVWDLAIF